MFFQPIQIQRSSDSAAEQILELVRNGVLKPGDRLPGQRKLGELLHVGRSSVREAFRTLETLGILKTAPGRGTFVCSTPLTHLSSSLSLWLVQNQSQVLQVLEVREAIESKAAALAAIRATPEQIKMLEDCLAAMKEAAELGREHDFPILDTRFHESISRASGNDLLMRLIDSIADVIRPSREAILELPGRPLRSVSEHEQILIAIRNHDPVSAANAMVEHLVGVAHEVALITSIDNLTTEPPSNEIRDLSDKD
jgi:GntR family transcriptional repressor for pyruvate dehydrogenase complex